MLPVALLNLVTFGKGNFVPVEWTPTLLTSEQCEVGMISDISDALATMAELMKNNDVASSFLKSCMELKEDSPVSPSGYYTISNGSGGSVVVYCNMDELYSCPSLELTLKAISNNLATNSACQKISASCQEVWDKCPKCTSGYYKILAADLTEKNVYCSFEEKCGTAGPWTRVAYLNMSDSSSVCPSGTQKFVSGSVVACGISEPLGTTCVSIINPVPHLTHKFVVK